METREPFHTVAETDRRIEAMEQMFMVELIDSKTGASHGYIGYRFRAPGAQAAADGWNNCRERGDLVAVIRPVVEPAVIEVTPGQVDAASDHLAEIKTTPRRHTIATEVNVLSKCREDRRMLRKALLECVAAMNNGRPVYGDKHWVASHWNQALSVGREALTKVT